MGPYPIPEQNLKTGADYKYLHFAVVDHNQVVSRALKCKMKKQEQEKKILIENCI